MRQVREVLRLRTAGVGLNEIARRVGVAPSTVRLTLKRLRQLLALQLLTHMAPDPTEADENQVVPQCRGRQIRSLGYLASSADI